MKGKRTDVRADVLERLNLGTRTEGELFALLAIMEKQQRCFTTMACRRASKSLWSHLAPLRYRAGWLCAAVSGMLFITATSVAYNEYSANDELRARMSVLESRREQPVPKVKFADVVQPVKDSCMPVQMGRGEYMLFPALKPVEKTEKAKREAIEKLTQIATMCMAH